MNGLPELERKYVDYRYGFTTGKPMRRSAVAKILDVPEAELQKALAQKSQKALFDNFAGTHVDMLLAQYDEEDE